jgi:quinol monooxygenase YgiN
MGQALLVVRHSVEDYAAWREVYETVEPLRQEFGCTSKSVWQDPANPNDVTVLHYWPSVGQAAAFANSDGLHEAMGRAGVAGPPRVEIVAEA